MGRVPRSPKHQWLVDHLDDYVIRSKVKDETLLYNIDDIKYYCEMDVSVNCLELILLGLTADGSTFSEQGGKSLYRSVSLKKILTSLVEDVARHAIVVESVPISTKEQDGVDGTVHLDGGAHVSIDKIEFMTISEGMELRSLPPYENDKGAKYQSILRLVPSSLKRTVKRRKAKPRYPVYMWVLAGSHDKRIVPPRHATDFYYRLLEGKVGYPLNYLGACIKDLSSQGIVEVLGKRLVLTDEGAELARRFIESNMGHSAIRWKVRVGYRKVVK